MFNAAVGLYMDELLPQLDYRKYDIIVFAIGQSKSMKSKEEMPQIAETVSDGGRVKCGSLLSP